jgi:hypothetical protein
MSAELYLRRRPWDGRVYRRVEDYDPVLRSHCGMEPDEEVKKEEKNDPDTADRN